MRQRRRRFPTIGLDSQVLYACYKWKDNRILFGCGIRNISDDGIVYMLIHEIEHFAQNMFLDDNETEHSIKGFNRHRNCPFVEYITAHPGDYDFSGWEKKYGRGVLPGRLERYVTLQ